MVGSDYDIDYSGLSIRGDQDIGTTTLENDSTVREGSGTRNRDLWNDVTYAEYSKITTLQTRKWTRRSFANMRFVCMIRRDYSDPPLRWQNSKRKLKEFQHT